MGSLSFEPKPVTNQIYNFEQECIPVGCVPFAAVATGGGGCLLGGCLPKGGSAWGVYAPVHAGIKTAPCE